MSTKAPGCPHCGAPVVADPPASSLREDPPTPPLLSSSQTAPGAKAEIPDFSPWKDSDSRWWITPAGQKASSLLVKIGQETGQPPSMQARESICLLCMQEGPSITGESLIGSRSGNTRKVSGKKGKLANGVLSLIGILACFACLGFGLAPIYFIFAGESDFPPSIALRVLISLCCLALAWGAFLAVRKIFPILASQEARDLENKRKQDSKPSKTSGLIGALAQILIGIFAINALYIRNCSPPKVPLKIQMPQISIKGEIQPTRFPRLFDDDVWLQNVSFSQITNVRVLAVVLQNGRQITTNTLTLAKLDGRAEHTWPGVLKIPDGKIEAGSYLEIRCDQSFVACIIRLHKSGDRTIWVQESFSNRFKDLSQKK